MDEKREPVSVWTIAGGVLLALVILRGCDQVQTAVAQREAIEQLNAALASLKAPAPPARHAQSAHAATSQAVTERPQQPHTERQRVPLAPDERCLSGQRFRRVANGWIQNGSC